MTKKLRSPLELKGLQERLMQDIQSKKPVISVCGGTGCHGCGCELVYNEFISEIDHIGMADRVKLKLPG